MKFKIRTGPYAPGPSRPTENYRPSPHSQSSPVPSKTYVRWNTDDDDGGVIEDLNFNK